VARLIGDAYIAILPQLSQFRTDADAGVRRALGTIDADVMVGADMAEFTSKVEAYKQILADGPPADIKVGADILSAQRGMAEMLAESQVLRERLGKIPLSMDDSMGITAMRAMGGELDELIQKLTVLQKAKLNPALSGAIDNELRRLTGQVDTLQAKMAHLDPHMDSDDARTQLAAMMLQVEDISAGLKDMELDPNDFKGKAKLLSFQSQVMAIARELGNMPLDADTLPMQVKLASLIAEARGFQEVLSASKADPSDLDILTSIGQFSEADRSLNMLEANIEKLGDKAPAAMELVSDAASDLRARLASLRQVEFFSPDVATEAASVSSDVKRLDAAFKAIVPDMAAVTGGSEHMAHGFGIFGRAIAAIQNTHIPLFATSTSYAENADAMDKGIAVLGKNFLTTASGAHLLIETVIELTAVWGPAIVGMTAFGIAAYPIAKDIYTQFSNMKTVVEATGQSLKSSATGLTSMRAGVSGVEAAIKPEVLQLWGDFLTLKGSSHFADVMKQIGGVLDDFGAKIAVDLNSKTTSTFLEHASSDIAGLGDAFIQLGRIIGTLLKAVPGYAELLLKFGDAALTGMADVVQAAEPAIAIFLKVHGAIFYLGLGGGYRVR
jgi:hypothetical protein